MLNVGIFIPVLVQRSLFHCAQFEWCLTRFCYVFRSYFVIYNGIAFLDQGSGQTSSREGSYRYGVTTSYSRLVYLSDFLYSGGHS